MSPYSNLTATEWDAVDAASAANIAMDWILVFVSAT